ncbi:hypothetical protein H6F43_03430 [Leptolyngbya sp. FACHB-36]|nr:hypothetical protein [Leptolyngbya sp. FACHB-36]
MTLSTLLQQTAIRYQAAVESVLADWSPDCGCNRPGLQSHCGECPCLSEFEQLVQEKIHRSAAESGVPTSFDRYDRDLSTVQFPQSPL